MSLLSLRGKNAREKDDKFLENTSLARLAKLVFRQATPPQYSRKEPRQPLLTDTPDSERETLVRLWRVMLKFTGDITDYRQGMKTSMQPNLGSVMSRLYKELGMSVDEYPRRSGTNSGDTGTASAGSQQDDGSEINRALPTKPKGGTLRRLRVTLTERLFRHKAKTIFHSLPIENTLMSPLDQVHFIVGYGILKPQLRDEIYCQICKMLVNNPYKSGVTRCWLLLSLIIGCFAPSSQIANGIVGFVNEGPPIYSTPLKKLLQDSLRNGGSRFQPPSYLELQAYQDKTPMQLQVTLMDGTVHTVVADGTTTARDLCRKVDNSLGLRNNFGYSVFVSMFGKVASLGSGANRVMDAISQCEQIFRDHDGSDAETPWRLFYRKELFSPWEDTAGDMMAISLTYAQIIRGVMLEEYVCDADQDVAILAARQYYIEYGSEISEQGLHDLLPSYIPSSCLKGDDSLKTWRRLVLKAHNKTFSHRDSSNGNRTPSIDRVKMDVVNYAKVSWAMSFSRYFDVSGLEGPVCEDDKVAKMAVNSTGVYFLSFGKKILLEVSFPEVLVMSGESTSPDNDNDIVVLVLADGSLIKFESLDAADIRELVGDIMSGLRMRSVWALVRKDPAESETDDVSAGEGDLIKLDTPLVDGSADKCCSGVNIRTAQRCRLTASCLYVVPVMNQPSESVLKPFRTTRHNGCSFSVYVEDCALPRASSQDWTSEDNVSEPVINSNQNIPMITIAEINEPEPEVHDDEKEGIDMNIDSNESVNPDNDSLPDNAALNVSERSVHFTDSSPEIIPHKDSVMEPDQPGSNSKILAAGSLPIDGANGPLKYQNFRLALHDTVTAL